MQSRHRGRNILTLVLCGKTLGKQADRETRSVPRIQYCSISYILIAVTKDLTRINLKEDTLELITVEQPMVTGKNDPTVVAGAEGRLLALI